MHHSSESIGTIAAALAKAQLELTNPEKSLTGTIPGMTLDGVNASWRRVTLGHLCLEGSLEERTTNRPPSGPRSAI